MSHVFYAFRTCPAYFDVTTIKEKMNPIRKKRIQNHPRKVEDVSNRPKEPEQIIEEQIEESLSEYRKSKGSLFLSSVIAGLDLGFSLLVMGILYTMFNDSVSGEIMQLILAAAYPLGFIFVVLGRSTLFTEHTTLAVLPVLSGRETIRNMAIVWGIIYSGNLLGGYLIGGMLSWLGPQLEIISVHALEEIALHLMKADGILILGSGILAGWLMGLLSWLVTSSQETISRIAIVVLITFAIGLGSLHHCIVGSTELFAGLLVSEKITIAGYLTTQGWATLGNIIGGAFFVSILKFKMVQK
jgi:formate/nitrite transporter FocA (FNT family)